MRANYFDGVNQTIARRGVTVPPADAETLAAAVERINQPTMVLLDVNLLYRGDQS